MSKVNSIVPKSRFRRIAKGAGFDATRFNSTIQELIEEVQELQAFHNDILVPLLITLPAGSDDDEFPSIGSSIDSVLNGLSGDQIWSDETADEDSSDVFWSEEDSRKLTLKESLLELVTRIDDNFSTLQTQINDLSSGVSSYTKTYIGAKAFDEDDSSSSSSMDGRISRNNNDIDQLAKDVFSDNYALNGDGEQSRTYPLIQLVDALLGLHNGSSYQSGYSYDTTVSLDHTIFTSDLVLDDRIPQTFVDSSDDYTQLGRSGLVEDLQDDLNRLRFEVARVRGTTSWESDSGVAPAYDSNIISLAAHIDEQGSGTATSNNPHGMAMDDVEGLSSFRQTTRTFVGMDNDGDSTPDYSTHGPIAIVSDGDSLEKSIQKLDEGIVQNNLMGHVWIPAGAFGSQNTTYDAIEGTNFLVQKFDATTAKNAIAVIGIPIDSTGGLPTAFRAVYYFVTSSGGTGSGAIFETKFSNPPGGTNDPGLVRNDTTIPPYSDIETLTITSMEQSKFYVEDAGEFTFNPAPTLPGPLIVYVGRKPSASGDDWTADVGLLGVGITFYR